MRTRTITITVSDDDFERALRHIANERPGKPRVSVEKFVAVNGEAIEALDARELLDSLEDGSFGMGTCEICEEREATDWDGACDECARSIDDDDDDDEEVTR